jgi:hypothetical protein
LDDGKKNQRSFIMDTFTGQSSIGASETMDTMMSLSAIIISPASSLDNPLLKRAEESVSFADEVLIFREDKPISDYSAVRNEVLSKAKGEWVLFVDSDEEVTAKLADEIQQALHQSTVGFLIRRRDYLLGRWLKFGETGRAKFLRLARKDAGQWIRPVHEQWVVDGSIGTLKEPLLHRPHLSVISMLEKIDRYAKIEAGYRHRATRRSILRIIIEMMIFPKAKFFQNYLLRLGCLDEFPGLVMALMMSFHSFLVRSYQIQVMLSDVEASKR